MTQQTTDSPIRVNAPAATVGGAVVDVAAALAESNQLSRAISEVNDLLIQAVNVRNAAMAHLSENPEDAHEAGEAVALARRALGELQDAKSSSAAGYGRRPDVAQLVNQVGGAVQHANTSVHGHEGGTASAATKKALIHTAAASSGAVEVARKPAASIIPNFMRPARSRDVDDDDDRDTGERNRPRNPVAAGWNRLRNDQGAVGGAARAVEGGVRGTARAAGFVVSGEAAESAATATSIGVDGAAAILQGDREGIDREGQRWGRGVRNVLRDDLGVDGNTAQAAGRAVTVAAQTAGRAGAVVTDTARNAGAATANAARAANRARDDASDRLGDQIARRDNFGRQLDSVIGVFSHYRLFDTDRDGKVELHEVREALEKRGIKMSDIDTNRDGDITAQEMQAALRRKGLIPQR